MPKIQYTISHSPFCDKLMTEASIDGQQTRSVSLDRVYSLRWQVSENSFEKKKNLHAHVYTYIHTYIYIFTHGRYIGEFHMNARQTASRVVDSSRLSWNKCNTGEPAITLFVPGDAFPRPSIGGNVHLENSSPPSLRFTVIDSRTIQPLWPSSNRSSMIVVLVRPIVDAWHDVVNKV